MAKTSTLAALLSMSLLAACGPSTENFRRVIDEALAKECALYVKPTQLYTDFPLTIMDARKCYGTNGRAINEKTDAVLMPFVKAGLLSVTPGTKVLEDWDFPQGSCRAGTAVPGRTFTPSSLGNKYLVSGNSFCVGHYKVDQIVRFTPPANAFGTTQSEVTFTVRGGEIADWAKTPDLQKAKAVDIEGVERIRDFQALHGQFKRTLYLASDGWRDQQSDSGLH